MREDSEGLDAIYGQELDPHSSRTWPRGWNYTLASYSGQYTRRDRPVVRGRPPSARAGTAGSLVEDTVYTVSYTHLTLPTKREV